MSISDSAVAIIGIGNIGGTLAANFAAGGQDFLLAGRDQEATRKLAAGLDGHAEAVSIDEAVDRADDWHPGAAWQCTTMYPGPSHDRPSSGDSRTASTTG